MHIIIGLIISGLPASGKGTQAALVADEYGFLHIDAGESLRKEVDQESDIGREARKYMSKGELVPDGIIKKLMQQKMWANRDKRGIVFDGFP